VTREDIGREPRLIRALRGETIGPPPIWLMRQAGRYLPEYRELRRRVGGFVELCLTPELAAEVTLQPLRRYGLDAAILFSDILMIPYGLGQKLDFREGEGPVLEPIASRVDLARLDVGAVLDRVVPVFDTVRRVRAGLPDGAALIGFAGSPWTVASYMVEGGSTRDFAKVKGFAYGDEAGFAELIACIEDATVDYLVGQIDAGAQALQLFDSWAGVLAEPAFRRWAIEPTRRIIDRVRASRAGIPLIGFPRGGGLMIRAYAEETGVDAVGLDTTIPLGEAAALQRLIPVQGNLDPQLVVIGGAAMEDGARAILEALGDGPFVFNLGHGIVPETPPEHVGALVDFVRSWRR
jgi:uroporphyrinogen decarboxylase